MRYILILMTLFACTLEPKYNKPESLVNLKESTTEKDITQVYWQDFFRSPELQVVVKTALENNQDLKVAYLNIESARAMFDVKRKELIPTINTTASVVKQEAPAAFALFTPKSIYRANLNISTYELDFFGKLRSAKKSSHETLLSTEEAKNVMEITLITEVANSYIQLLVDQKILDLTTTSLATQERKLQIIEHRRNNGRALRTDVILAKTEYQNIKVLKNSYQKLVEQDKNALMLLMGIFDETNIPQLSIDSVAFNENVLEFIPSKALLSRPDIKQAENLLKSANADIGIARAAFFPSISLTGNYGYYSRALSNLFNSNPWSLMPQVNLPIFDGGKNKANLKLTKTKQKILTAQYQKTIQVALREVLDELVNRKTIVEQVKSYQEIAKLNQQSYDIIQQQNLNGITDAVIVSDSHLKLITAKQNVVMQQQEYFQNLIMLYKVFGGGSNVS